MNAQEEICTHCGLQTNIEETVITEKSMGRLELPKHDRPKTFVEAFLRMDMLRTISALIVIFLFTMIVITFIINPKALNTENNGMIGIVIGMIITKFGDVVNNYFKKVD